MTSPYLECDRVSRHFGGLAAVDAVSLTVTREEIRAVIGPNGAGKSTLFNVIAGALRPTAGSVRFKGERVSGLPPHAVASRGICRTFQLTALFRGLSALENVRLAAQARDGRRWRPAGARAALADTRRSAERWLERVHLTDVAATPAGVLSHGDQRLLEIAMALAQEPELLLLDEPSQGLAPLVVRELAGVIRTLAAQGVAILLVEQNLKLATLVADRIFVMLKGRVVYDATPERFRADEADIRRRYLTL